MNKYQNLISPILIISLIGIFNSCKICQPHEEPSIFISFYKLGPSAFYAPEELDTIFSSVTTLNNPKEITLSGRKNFPINLNADSVTYIFRSGNIRDTLSIHYKREFQYENRCGYKYKISNYRIIEPTSFDSVSILYQGNIRIYF